MIDFNAMTSRLRAGFYGAYIGLGLILFAALVAFLVGNGLKYERNRESVQPKLASWSNQRVLAELGEAQTVSECDSIVGAPGFTARLFVNEQERRVVVVCTPAK